MGLPQTCGTAVIMATIVYASVDGHTRKIAEAMAGQLRDAGEHVSLLPLADFDIDAFSQSDSLVSGPLIIGASIRYGVHCHKFDNWVIQHLEQLQSLGAAFFSVNLVARKAQKCAPDTNPYTRKFLQKTGWKPALAAVFAGRLNYPVYGFWDKLMIRFIMWMTGGPTDPATDIEYTDWSVVAKFAQACLTLNANTSSIR